MKNAWLSLSPEEFETVVAALVREAGYQDVRKLSGPNDRGEDIVAFLPSEMPGVRLKHRRWVFQCKRVKKITRTIVTEELSRFAASQLDTWVLVAPVNPSNEFRRWFEKLTESGNYNFYVEAWWLDELERLKIKYRLGLADALEPEVLAKILGATSSGRLGTRNSECDDLSYLELCSRLRTRVSLQIGAFARKKYLPELYVGRRVETEISGFFEPESVIAQQSYAKISTLVGDARDAFHALLEAKPAAKVAAELLDKKKIRTKKEERGFAEALWRASSAWASDVESVFERAMERIGELPRDLYCSERSRYEHIAEDLEELRRLFRTAPRLSPETVSDDAPEASGHKSSTSKLSYSVLSSSEGSDANLPAHILRCLDVVREVHKSMLLLIDRAGSGKTNLLCHLANTLSQEIPILLFFGKESIADAHSLKDWVLRELKQCIGSTSSSWDSDDALIEAVDRLVGTHGAFIYLLIDGINENRDIHLMERAIGAFLAWSEGFRVKTFVTCRDIYWEFFQAESWARQLKKTLRGRINEFTENEAAAAIPLYLSHFRIDAEVVGDARLACAHPLILRFFCEAYGAVGEGPEVAMGEVADIRLKEVFDRYLDRKMLQLSKALGLHNPGAIELYLARIARHMLDESRENVLSNEIEQITGDGDLSSKLSLYLGLLDEDIVIEERPTKSLALRKISFVYEEFMEYVLARHLLASISEEYSVVDCFNYLDAAIETWINSRGVGEYIAVMLIAGDGPADDRVTHGFLQSLSASDNSYWQSTYWSALSKVSPKSIGYSILDTLPGSLESLDSSTQVKKVVSHLERINASLALFFGEHALWSSLFPAVFSWSELETMMTSDHVEPWLEAIEFRYTTVRRGHSPGDDYAGLILIALKRLLDHDQRATLDQQSRLGESRGSVTQSLVRQVCRVFSTRSFYCLNGLWHEAEWVRISAAFHLRFVLPEIRSRTVQYCRFFVGQIEEEQVRRTLVSTIHELEL